MFKAKGIYLATLNSINFDKKVGEKHKEQIMSDNVQAGGLADYCMNLIEKEHTGGSLEIAAVLIQKFHNNGIRAFLGVVENENNEEQRYVVVFKIGGSSYVADIEKEFDQASENAVYGLKYEEFVAENPTVRVFKNLFGSSCNDVFFGDFYSKNNKEYLK